MITHIVILLVAWLFLAKGADLFVEYSARVAKRLNVSDFIIGLTVASLGTSVPELAASVSASLDGYSGLVIGTVAGSNIARIGLILGVAAIVRPLRADKITYTRDAYIMLASVLLFFAFAYDHRVSSAEAGILTAFYLVYALFFITGNLQQKVYYFKDFVKYVFGFEYLSPVRNKRPREKPGKRDREPGAPERQEAKVSTLHLLADGVVIVLSCIAVVLGAYYLVDEAIWLANLLNVPQSVIGLSVIAIGTSLPELTVALSAAGKGKGDMVIGTVIGSNIANTLLIIGISGLINPVEVAKISLVYSIPVMLLFSLGLLYFIKSDWTIRRWQGVIAIALYLTFMLLAFVMGWN